MAEPVKCDYPLCGKAASRCGVCDRSSPSNVRPRTGLNLGHGHVWPRPDGVKARCGGPGLCDECSADAAQAKAATPSATATSELREALKDMADDLADHLKAGSLKCDVCTGHVNHARDLLSTTDGTTTPK